MLYTYQSSEKDGCESRLVAATILTFCIHVVREIIFLSGKSQGILRSDVCGNRVFVVSSLRSNPFFFHFPVGDGKSELQKSGRVKEHAWGEPKNWGEVWRGLPLFCSFPSVREHLEKESKRLVHRLIIS